LCEAAFRGLHKAIKICLTSARKNGLFFGLNRVSLREYEALEDVTEALI
jgi:hypothetical protein